jgi:DNA-binding NarL/FixJ family response regulator
LKKVLISNSEILLSAGVAHLLLQNGSLNVIGSRQHPNSSLFVDINQYKPDIVIIDQSEHPLLLQILELFPKLCVIVLNSHNNWIQVFQRQELYIKEPFELTAAITRISAGLTE